MHRKAEQHAESASQQPGQHEFEGVSQRDRSLRLAQHAQHGAIVQVSCGKTARDDRHGDGAEQRRQQRDQIEEFFCPVQRLAHLGAAAFERLQPRAT